MKSILVAGGAGFIGSHLCEALLASAERRSGVVLDGVNLELAKERPARP